MDRKLLLILRTKGSGAQCTDLPIRSARNSVHGTQYTKLSARNSMHGTQCTELSARVYLRTVLLSL